MPPKYFGSISHPLTVTIALATLNLICQSLKVQAAEVQAAELVDGSDYVGRFQDTPSPPPKPQPATTVIESPSAQVKLPVAEVQTKPEIPLEIPSEIPPEVPSEAAPEPVSPTPLQPTTAKSAFQPPADPSPKASPDLSTPQNPFQLPDSDLTEPKTPPNQTPDPTFVQQTSEQTFEQTFVEQFEVEANTVANTVFNADQLAAVARQAVLSDQSLDELLNDFCDKAPTEPFQPISSADPLAQSPNQPSNQPPNSQCCPTAIDTAHLQVQRHLTSKQLQRATAALTQLYAHCGYNHAKVSLSSPKPGNIIQIQITEGPLEPGNSSGKRSLQQLPQHSLAKRSAPLAPPPAPSTSSPKSNPRVTPIAANLPVDLARDAFLQGMPHDANPFATPALLQDPLPTPPHSPDPLDRSNSQPPADIEANTRFDSPLLLDDLLNAFCDATSDDPFQDITPSTDPIHPNCSNSDPFKLQISDHPSDQAQSSQALITQSISSTSPFLELLSGTTTPIPILIAQASPTLSQIPRDLPRNNLPRILPPASPPLPPLPQDLPSTLPPPQDLLQPSGEASPQPETPPSEVPQTVEVQRFEVEGSTAFNAEDLAALAWQATQSNLEISDLLASYCLPESAPEADSPEAEVEAESTQTPPSSSAPSTAPDLSPIDRTAPDENPDSAAQDSTTQDSAAQDSAQTTAQRCCPRKIAMPDLHYPQQPISLSFDQLLRARSAITQLYINCGYITSGAILPPQTPADHDNIVTIQVVEGSLEEIAVTGTRRLNSSYVRSRLAVATTPPLRQQRLLQALQLLQLDPLIERISAELQAGTRPSTNILAVDVEEANSFHPAVQLDNNRSPSVGSFERGISLTEANLLGFGDGLSVGYTNTDGSNEVTANYQIPINPRNGTIGFAYQYTHSNVIEPPFDVLGISSDSFSYNLNFRQPLYRTPNTEFALGLSLSREEAQTRLSFDDIGPFPLSLGADDEGRTRVTALRFTQDWVNRTPRQVLAARSQFSLGLELFDSTINEVAPDSRFFAWRGQGQWVRQLDPNGFLILARTDMQFTNEPLVPLEQFGLGGQDTVRGYRQDALLTDNGIFASLELQYPILKVRGLGGKLYIVPFLDAGTAWNIRSPDPNPSTLVGTGLGLLWRQDNNNLSAQLYFGVPLVPIENAGEGTWQESGVYFSIRYSPF